MHIFQIPSKYKVNKNILQVVKCACVCLGEEGVGEGEDDIFVSTGSFSDHRGVSSTILDDDDMP